MDDNPPRNGFSSYRVTLQPTSAAVAAASSPAVPPPITTTLSGSVI